jgi:hypothetical protein
MTSNVNYASINENFPVAGQDNDTQVFRDNFDTIKSSLRAAQEEITALQANTIGLELTEIDGGSNYNNNIIYNAVLQYTTERKADYGAITSPVYTIEFENANYQIFRFGENVTIDFVLPTNTNSLLTPGVGKVTLEIYSDGSPRTLNFITTGGAVIKKNSGFPSPFIVSSDEDPIFVEVWQHNSNVIYMRYLGQFTV